MSDASAVAVYTDDGIPDEKFAAAAAKFSEGDLNRACPRPVARWTSVRWTVGRNLIAVLESCGTKAYFRYDLDAELEISDGE
jgi:hypothetical protein